MYSFLFETKCLKGPWNFPFLLFLLGKEINESQNLTKTPSQGQYIGPVNVQHLKFPLLNYAR